MLRRMLVLLVLAGFPSVVASAQGVRYPSRTIEIVVAYGPGGSTDLVARALAQKFQERLGQPAVVLNKPGGTGTIGALAAARAAPDGYTLYEGYTSETVIVPQLLKGGKYSLDDFEGIAVTGLVPLVLVTSKSMRANTLQELIAQLRAEPFKHTFGGGIASPRTSSAPGSTGSTSSMSRTCRTGAAARVSPTWSAATSTCSMVGSPPPKRRSIPAR